jgi:acetyl esterase/lipase
MRTLLSLALSILFLVLAIPATAQQAAMPLWPKGFLKADGPDALHTTGPERDITQPTDNLIAGRRIIKLTDVTEPTLTLYQPMKVPNTGAAVVVFPGGGYRILAYDLEGTEVCTWLNSIGVNCILVKYRVPILVDGKDARYPEKLQDLQDAQRAMRLTREHAKEWKIDPEKIGVLGFSAGGHLAVVLSIHSGEKTYQPLDAADLLSARPSFAVVIYPGYLSIAPKLDKVAASVEPNASTPPTFLLQAENDPVHEENALLYFQALKEAKVPAELHLYAEGGHGYGLRPTELPITHWPALVETWLHTIHVLGKP